MKQSSNLNNIYRITEPSNHIKRFHEKTHHHFHRYLEHIDNENLEKTSHKIKITTDKPIQKIIKKLYKNKKRNSDIFRLPKAKLDTKTFKNQINLYNYTDSLN